ncbi:MAG: hypothetical protein ACLQD9_05230 [Thermoplasmata archaeon]
MSAPEDFDPGMPGRVRARIRTALGPRWDRIEEADRRGRQARPPNPNRHLLAAIYENAGQFSLEEVAARYPGRLPDLLALTAVANILERSRDFEVLPELIASMVSSKDFRHHMLTLGLADHLRTHTPYTVRLPSPSANGQRIVDLVIAHEGGLTMEVETKTSDEFDGPRREVTPSNARGAISRAWRKAVSGERSQLGRTSPGLLLLGGVTLKVESLDVIQRAAGGWLRSHGRTHPNIWGIAVLTYWAYTLGPPPQVTPPGEIVEVNARAGIQLRAAENPSYTGPIRLVLTPYVWE